METTLELYRRAKIAAGVQSDYAMAKVLGVKANTCSNYVTGKARFDDEVAAKVADILGIEAGYVIACANAENEKGALVRRPARCWKDHFRFLNRPFLARGGSRFERFLAMA